jgi:hypothetical protein
VEDLPLSRAILQVTVDDDTTLLLTLQEYPVTNGVKWEWHLPNHNGWGQYDTGSFLKRASDITEVVCRDNYDTEDAMYIDNVAPRSQNVFPFTAADQQDPPRTGTLVVRRANYYLTEGSYTWTFYSYTP